MYSGGVLLVIAQIDSPLQMGFAVHVGVRVDLLNSGSGRMFFAFQNDHDRQRMLSLLSDASNLAVQINAFVKRVAKKGYESVPSDLSRGVTNMSYPVLDMSGRCAAARPCRICSGMLTTLPAKKSPESAWVSQRALFQARLATCQCQSQGFA